MGHSYEYEKARYLRRAAELRMAAERLANDGRAEALRKAAEAYERLAEWEAPEPIVGTQAMRR